MASAKGQLTKATKKLLHKWDDAEANWNDSVSSAMEHKHIEPLKSSVRAAIVAMDTMGEVLARAEQDCS
jgi:hypothetical protein